MSAEPPVAVVIPTWNSAQLLPGCLSSLRDQDEELELMVVDNGSTDATLRYLRERGIPHLSLPRNVGFAPAVNRGVAETASPLVMVLNVDTVVEPGCIAALRQAVLADPSLAGVQPRILQLEPEGKPARLDQARIYSVGQALTRDGRAVEEGAGCCQDREYLAAREIFGVCGAACLLQRELFAGLGGYDERYFAFYEDVDLNVRARIAGLRYSYVPDAVVWHLGNASWQAGFARPSAENARLVARNRLATQVKFMALGSLPRILAVEVGALARAAFRGRFLATLSGKLAALAWLPALLRERRRLGSSGDLERARAWLGTRAPIMPADAGAPLSGPEGRGCG